MRIRSRWLFILLLPALLAGSGCRTAMDTTADTGASSQSDTGGFARDFYRQALAALLF